ncbi:MAG: dihydrodipicolinate synthase family protein [Thermodesulfobacteriota bacterium]
MRRPIAGIFPALTTPFEKGRLSIAGLKFNIERYNRFDLSGYLVLGSTGESDLMDEKEGLNAIEAVRTTARKGRIIVVGTGMSSTRATIKFTNKAAEAGADFGLVVTPFYYKGQMTAKVLGEYYREVADHARIPILMYNVPKFTGLDLPLDTVLALAEHPNIAGLKESSGNVAFVSEIIKGVPAEFTVLQGMGSVLVPSLMMGVKGAILAVAVMTPAEAVEIYKLVQAGQYEKAKEIQFKILTVNQRIVTVHGIPGIKYALDLLGYVGGDPRPPLKPVGEEARTAIRKILEEANLTARKKSDLTQSTQRTQS